MARFAYFGMPFFCVCVFKKNVIVAFSELCEAKLVHGVLLLYLVVNTAVLLVNVLQIRIVIALAYAH